MFSVVSWLGLRLSHGNRSQGHINRGGSRIFGVGGGGGAGHSRPIIRCHMQLSIDNDIESPYEIVPDVSDFFLYSCERFCTTLLTPHGGPHSAVV